MSHTQELSVNVNFQPFGFIEWDVVNNTVEVCSYLAETLAFQTTETIQTYSAYRNLTYPDDIPPIELLAKKIREGNGLYIVVESRKLCRDGAWRWFSLRGKIIKRDENGNPVHAIGTLTDITNFKEKETQLKEMTFLSSEINNIKESNKECKQTFQEPSVYSKIIASLEKITDCSNSLFILASSNDFDKETGEIKKCTDHTKECVDLDSFSDEKLYCLTQLFLNKNHVIHNGEKTSFLGIYLDLPLEQQGLIILEREAVFDNTFLDSLEPFIGVVTNIIGFKRLEADHKELDNALSFFIQQVPAPVAMFDTNMCYKFASEAWCKSFKLGSVADLIGKSHYATMPKQPKVWKEQHMRALAGETLSCEIDNVLDLFDKPIWLEWTVHPWYTLDKSIGGIIIYSNNITDRVESQDKIKDAIDDLMRSNQALDRFAHVCSHDLKEPLRGISSFINLIFKDNFEHFNEDSLIYMSHVLKGIDRMSTLIQDILSFSELQQQLRTEKVPINLSEIVDEIKESFEFKISEIGAQIKTKVLPTVLGVRTQLSQLFSNLISNAIKFRSESPLVIDVFAIDKDAFWEFHVRDNGIGIEKEYHEIVFTMFKRLHSKSQHEGSGIGLATCQQIINDHHGEIYVHSVPGGGSDFIFILPKG